MLENIPRHGPDLGLDVRRAGLHIKQSTESELADLYPSEADGAKPVAYLWARTIRCEASKCGAEVPLMTSFWLKNQGAKLHALRSTVIKEGRRQPRVALEVFQPKTDSEVPAGTVNRAKAKCICCGSVLPPERVRTQLAEQRGGADVIWDEAGKRIGGAQMTAVVTQRRGDRERSFRVPTEKDYDCVWRAKARLDETLAKWERDGSHNHCPVPNELLPPPGTLGFRVQRYGILRWEDLFTARQKVALVELERNVNKLSVDNCSTATKEILALAISRFSDDFSALTHWMSRGTPGPTFTEHTLPMGWDFCELAPFDDASWSYWGSVGGNFTFFRRFFRTYTLDV